MVALPHELTDRIVDFLHEDRLALSSLSLAGRSFLPTARYHRFSHLILVGRFEQFGRLIDASPDIGPSVSSLALDSGLSPTVWRELAERYGPLLLDRMPGLQCLELRHLMLPFGIMRSLGHIARLHNLSLVGCNLPCPDVLARTISSLVLLDHLSIEDISYGEDGVIADDIVRPRIASLGVTGLTSAATSQTCAWILDGKASRDVRAFRTRIRSRDEAMATQDLIERLGETLTQFDMVVDADASLAGELIFTSIPERRYQRRFH